MTASPGSSNANELNTRRSWIWALCGVYFFALAGVLVSTYLPRYFESIGISTAAIGVMYSARSLSQSAMNLSWATLADRFGAIRRIIQLQYALGLLALVCLPFTEIYPVIFAIIVIHGITAGCAVPLVDALTLREVGSARFGTLRAWGSAGFGLMALCASAAGLWASHAELAALAPWLMIATGLATLASASRFPAIDANIDRPSARDALRLLSRPVLLLVFPICALHWASQAPYNLFIVFLCEQRGLGAWAPGLAVALGVFAEIVAFANGARLLRAFRPYTLIVICVVVTALRWYGTGVFASAPAILALQLLHGLSFGAFFVAMMAILGHEIAPSVRATAQALLYFVVFGLGGALGNALSGLVLDHHGAATLFRWAGWWELGVFVIALAILPYVQRIARPTSATP
ncbi:MAG: MFS transporter [Bradymonadaceae bacterium]|nr:MFS transporter [Lujinxingiaceae bacterium]